jgi:hypothetical protein
MTNDDWGVLFLPSQRYTIPSICLATGYGTIVPAATGFEVTGFEIAYSDLSQTGGFDQRRYEPGGMP